MPKTEKVQKGNHHQLVIRLHTFPRKSISRFASSDGRVQLHMRPENLIRRAKPNDKIFCANRSWDHGTEVGLIKKIEDDFQRLAEMVIGGQVLQFDQSQTHIISAFYVLWMVRAEIRRQPEQDRSLNGMQSSRQWSKDEEEQLEKAGLAFFRGNIVPGRIANGMRVHVTIGRYLRQINPTAKWGIVEALDGEFVVPDWPIYALVPITPTLALANPAIKQTLNRDGVALVNGQLRAASRRYFFARDFSACP